MSRGVTELGAKAVIQATELVTWKDLCEAAAKGEHFDAGGATLRGDLLSEWCRLPDPDRETRRLWIRNATIDGDLDLHDHEALFDIRFELCTFQGSLTFRGGSFKRIALLGCSLTGNFDAAEAEVDEGLTIAQLSRPGSAVVVPTIQGRLILHRIRVKGNVTLTGLSLTLSCSNLPNVGGGWAEMRHIASLDLEDAVIDGMLIMDSDFRCAGVAWLPNAMIGKQWICDGGKFLHVGANCLFAQGIRVGADCFLSGDFEAQGEVNLTGAQIGGQWDCAGGQFRHGGTKCLFAQDIHVGEHCFLRGGFVAAGEVNLNGALIGGQWSCTDGKFLHQGAKCLYAQRIRVRADCFLNRGFEALGRVDLNSAVFEGDVELGGSFRSQPAGIADSVSGAPAAISLWRATITGTLDIENFNCWGLVKLRELHVGRDLRVVTSTIGSGSDKDHQVILCDGSVVVVPACSPLADGLVAFDADGIEVAGLFDFRPDDVRGKIDLTDGEFGNFCDHFGLPKGGGPAMSIQGHKPWGFVTEWFQYVRDLLRDTWTCLTRPRHFKALCSATHRPSHSQYKLNGVKVHSLHTECVHDARSIADWIRAADDGKFNGPLYLELAKLLSAKGHDEESRELNILKRVHQRQDLRTSVPKRVLDRVFFDFPIRYGYKPFFAIMNGLLCWFLLFVTSTLAVNNQMMAPASSDVLVVAAQKRDDAVMADRTSAVANQSRQIRDLGDVEGISRAYDALDQPITASVMPFVPSGYPKFNPVIYAADRFVPLVDFGQAEMWVPDVNQKGGFWLMWFETAMILWGWILSTLLVASLTGLIKTDK